MDAPKGVQFPEGVDETKLNGLVQSLLDNIDRDHLFQDERLTRVRHPLLAQQMGRDTALNTEIHNLITNIVRAWYFLAQRPEGDEFTLRGIPQIESILSDSAKNPEALREALTTLKEITLGLAAVNPSDDGAEVDSLVSDMLRGKLTMPSAAQELLLYPPVTVASLGGSREEITRAFEGIHDQLLAALEGATDSGSEVLRNALKVEAAAVQAWLEKTAM